MNQAKSRDLVPYLSGRSVEQIEAVAIAAVGGARARGVEEHHLVLVEEAGDRRVPSGTGMKSF